MLHLCLKKSESDLINTCTCSDFNECVPNFPSLQTANIKTCQRMFQNNELPQYDLYYTQSMLHKSITYYVWCGSILQHRCSCVTSLKECCKVPEHTLSVCGRAYCTKAVLLQTSCSWWAVSRLFVGNGFSCPYSLHSREDHLPRWIRTGIKSKNWIA